MRDKEREMAKEREGERERERRGKSERGLEVVSGRGGASTFTSLRRCTIVYIPLRPSLLSTAVFSFDSPSSGGPTSPVLSARAEGFGSSGHLFFPDPASRAVQTTG